MSRKEILFWKPAKEMEDYVPKNHLLKHEIQAFMLGSGAGGGGKEMKGSWESKGD